MKLPATPLQAYQVSLIPLSHSAHAALTEVALQHPQVFVHIPYRMDSEACVKGTLSRVQALQDSGSACVYVVMRQGVSQPIGCTSLRLVDEHVPTLEIGGTWLVPDWQRTDTNQTAKRLLLGHAFETLNAERVEFKTDVRNTVSQAAIERLGARREGVLRASMRRADGSLRDSVYYSVLRSEWPEVKARIEERLGRRRPT